MVSRISCGKVKVSAILAAVLGLYFVGKDVRKLVASFSLFLRRNYFRGRLTFLISLTSYDSAF